MAKDKISSFKFEPGTHINGRYVIQESLGSGQEGEVYRVIESSSGVERAAKFYFPDRDLRNVVAARNAKKLHKLAYCPIIVRYHGQDTIKFHGVKVTYLISEYVEGEILSNFISRQPEKRISVMQGLILLHNMAEGLESMHRLGEYHGDIHSENILVRRYGLGFHLKLLDLHHWGDSKRSNYAPDICNSIRIFYDVIGGAERYSKHPVEVKDICMGLKSSLINRKFRTAGELKKHLETIEWHSTDRV